MNTTKLDVISRVDWTHLNNVLKSFEDMRIQAEPYIVRRLKWAWIKAHAASEWEKLLYASYVRVEANELHPVEDRQLSALIELIWALKALAVSEHAEDMRNAMWALTYALDIPHWVRPIILDILGE